MLHRTDIISAPQVGLVVRRLWIDGSARFAGAINGRECVLSPTYEGAAQALLRRACHSAAWRLGWSGPAN
jgi:hypothetical protein